MSRGVVSNNVGSVTKGRLDVANSRSSDGDQDGDTPCSSSTDGSNLASELANHQTLAEVSSAKACGTTSGPMPVRGGGESGPKSPSRHMMESDGILGGSPVSGNSSDRSGATEASPACPPTPPRAQRQLQAHLDSAAALRSTTDSVAACCCEDGMISLSDDSGQGGKEGYEEQGGGKEGYEEQGGGADFSSWQEHLRAISVRVADRQERSEGVACS